MSSQNATSPQQTANTTSPQQTVPHSISPQQGCHLQGTQDSEPQQSFPDSIPAQSSISVQTFMPRQRSEEVEIQSLSDLLRSRKRLSETRCRAIGAQILTAWQLSPSKHSPSARERVVSAAFIIAECATGMTLDRNVHWSMNSLLALGCPAKLARDLAKVFANPSDEEAMTKLFAWPKSADGNECPEAVEFESGVVAGLEPLPLVSPPHNVENDPNRWRENSRRSFKELLEIFSIDPHP